MSEPTVKSETVILLDADGNVTKDKAKAVKAEVVQKMSDGSTRSTFLARE
jgi:hypothetical protein